MTGQVGLQLLVFAAVAAVTAYFASRVSVMGAEREALAGELRQARLEAADVLRSVPTGIVTVDQAGHLLYCNPAAEQILGFKERQWRGRPIMPEFAKIAPSSGPRSRRPHGGACGRCAWKPPCGVPIAPSRSA